MTSFFNPYDTITRSFVRQLRDTYEQMYGVSQVAEYGEIIGWVGNMAMEIIANSDALYHNVEHTMHVTLVGQEILRGKHIKEGGVSREDWLHFVVSLLFHDIGYVKGICMGDKPNEGIYEDGKGGFVTVAVGSTDASLTPHHVDRGKLFVKQRFGNHKILKPEIIAANIELTRFPVPQDDDHRDTTGFPGLVRSADLIGQLSDPRYLSKTPALFYEFEETGETKKRGWKTPADIKTAYPGFFWHSVANYVKPALQHLGVTHSGKVYLANLYAQVFAIEHGAELGSKQ
jgi:hypothetical protein